MPFSPYLIVKLISFWPPFLFSGIRVKFVNKDLTHIRVRLKVYFWNKNYFGTHFGGSLYSMCDPFFVFMIAQKMAKDHIIWDKSANIEFIKAVSDPVYVDFKINNEDIEELKSKALKNFSIEKSFNLDILDKEGVAIAKVQKTVYIRRKDAKSRFKK